MTMEVTHQRKVDEASAAWVAVVDVEAWVEVDLEVVAEWAVVDGKSQYTLLILINDHAQTKAPWVFSKNNVTVIYTHIYSYVLLWLY